MNKRTTVHLSNLLPYLQILYQGRKLTFLGRRQLATDLFFSVAKWENVAASCEILVASAKFVVALATRKAQFRTLCITS